MYVAIKMLVQKLDNLNRLLQATDCPHKAFHLRKATTQKANCVYMRGWSVNTDNIRILWPYRGWRRTYNVAVHHITIEIRFKIHTPLIQEIYYTVIVECTDVPPLSVSHSSELSDVSKYVQFIYWKPRNLIIFASKINYKAFIMLNNCLLPLNVYLCILAREMHL